MSPARNAAAAAALVALVAAIYFPALGFGFVALDDPFHVTGNPAVRAGLTPEGLRAALRENAGYWIPLTWLSHMLDVELFGLAAGGHHATNVVLHAANAVLVGLWLARATGQPWAALVTAALFAAHPLRVESVAWVAERKDVLSGACFWLALLTWDRFRRGGSRAARAVSALAWLASLLAKPMAVTLPLLLLVLDFWPYRRLGSRAELRRALWEKLPLFGIAALFAGITLATQSRAGALGELGGLDARVSVAERLANALWSIALYLRDSVWPGELSPLYPHPYLPGGEPPGPLALGLCAVLVGAIGGLAVALRRRAPALLAGATWFLVALLPVLGLVQAGVQGRADRFTYLPQVGLIAALVFPAAAWAAPRRRAGAALAVLAGAAVLGLGWRSRQELLHWRDAETLYVHALRNTPRNPLLHTYYGQWLAQQGRPAEALVQYEQAGSVPAYAAASQVNRGVLLEASGLPDEALSAFERAVELAPGSEPAELALARALLRRGRRAEALPHLERARSGAERAPGNAASTGMGDTAPP